MKRAPYEPEMMGATEAAQTLGVRQTNLRIVKGLPEPYQVIAGGTLYRASEIRELAYQREQQRTPHTTTEEPDDKCHQSLAAS